MGSRFFKTGYIFALSTLMLVFATALFAQQPSQETDIATIPEQTSSKPLISLRGKTVWLVDVNSTDNYIAPLQAALIDELQQYAPGMIIRHVITGEKGNNPFFLLKREKYPDAVIICLGLCGETTGELAHYASQAGEKGIPSVMCYLADMRDRQMDWNQKYRIPEAKAIEIKNRPLSMQEAIQLARQLAPVFIENLKY